MRLQQNSYQVGPGLWLRVLHDWSRSFKELWPSQPLTQKLPFPELLVVQIFMFLKQPVQELQRVQFLMFIVPSCRLSRLWGLLSLRGHNPTRTLSLCLVSRVLSKNVALFWVLGLMVLSLGRGLSAKASTTMLVVMLMEKLLSRRVCSLELLSLCRVFLPTVFLKFLEEK
jgi:hypothetical protein